MGQWGVAWCAVLWCGGFVLCGTVLCGVVWCGVVLCYVVWCLLKKSAPDSLACLLITEPFPGPGSCKVQISSIGRISSESKSTGGVFP